MSYIARNTVNVDEAFLSYEFLYIIISNYLIVSYLGLFIWVLFVSVFVSLFYLVYLDQLYFILLWVFSCFSFITILYYLF